VTDPAAGFRRLGEREIHRGHVIRMVVATFVGPDGQEFTRDVVRTPSAVAIVPVDRGPDGGWQVVLVRQYRAPIEASLLELPAGMCDVEGEPAEETAQRELVEEAGYRARVVRPLTTYHPAAGFTDHHTTILLGVGLDEVGRQAHGIEEQHLSVESVALDEAIELIDSGQITDGKTIVGLLLARARLEG
jgi:8-oxo-dGTP pyrophosphatase MutT (NUDIX family)